MKRSSLFGVVGLAVVGCASTSLVILAPEHALSSEVEPAPTATPLFPTRELAELDGAVQAYFKVIPSDGSFGFSRLPTFRPRHAAYNPHSKEDRAIVSKLRDNKQEVVFFLVGREKFAARSFSRQRVQGPIVITSPFASAVAPEKEALKQAQTEVGAVVKSAPTGPELLPIADEVFASTQSDKGAQKQVGAWQVTACPIQASSPECVTCHNNMARAAKINAGSTVPTDHPDLVALGDTLGVALYCYRSTVKVTTKN